MTREENSLAVVIASVIHVFFESRVNQDRSAQLHKLKNAINGAKALGQIPGTVMPIAGNDVIPLARKLNEYRNTLDLEGLANAILRELSERGLPFEIIEAAQKLVIMRISAGVERVSNEETQRRELFQERRRIQERERIIKLLQRLQTQIRNELRRLGEEVPPRNKKKAKKEKPRPELE